MAAWKLPVIVAALVLPIIVGFLVGGPAIGVAAGAFVVLAILVVAARQRPRGPIGTAGKGQRRVLLVITCAVEEPGAIERIAGAAGLAGGRARSEAGDEAEVVVLAPARVGFLDRWASDVESARRLAQQSLVVTVAALAKAGIAAEARVGDEDIVQAVEDQLQSFPASDVILVSAGEEALEGREAVAEELASRLRARFSHVELAPV